MNKIVDINEKTNTVEPATDNAEQIQARANLHAIIPDLTNDNEKIASDEPIASAVDSLYGLLSLVPIGLSFAGLKNTANVWSESTCQGLANACVPVFRKYAWGQKIIVFLETGGGVEELALMAVVMPIGLATYKAYSADTYTGPQNADSNAMQQNPARFSKNGIELANADDVDYAARN